MPSQYTDVNVNQLVLNKLTASKYNELKNAGDINANELYLVEDPVVNAGGNQIVNVANPVNSTDAANKAYVDSHGGGGSAEIVNFDDVESGDDITPEMFNKLITPGTMISRNNTIYTQIELYPLDTDEDGYSYGGATYACSTRTNHYTISIDGWNEEEWSTELFFDVNFNRGKYDADLNAVLLAPIGASGQVDTEDVMSMFASGRCIYYNDRLYVSAGGDYTSSMTPDKLVLISREGTTEYRLEFHAEGTDDNRVWYGTPEPIVTTIGGGGTSGYHFCFFGKNLMESRSIRVWTDETTYTDYSKDTNDELNLILDGVVAFQVFEYCVQIDISPRFDTINGTSSRKEINGKNYLFGGVSSFFGTRVYNAEFNQYKFYLPMDTTIAFAGDGVI